MARAAIPLVLLVICYAIFFGYVGATYGSLPAKMASHFNIGGNPDGWMSRDTCVQFTLGMGILMPVFVVVVMAGAAWIPISFINLPHRDYWLVPERRRTAVAILRCYALWFACLNVLFVTGIQWLLVRANQPGVQPYLPMSESMFLGGLFVVATIAWLVLLLRRFSKIS